ncbi:glutathione S-transferase psoE [Aspergillus lucknowensis]|uniref:Glutathione S-transferase n=1 Tax=Aspergillus lucknowensis TaxID=176173 RepID=A0ABR4LSJ7_9EURO
MSFGTLYTRPFNPRSLAILAIAKANNLELEVKTITSSSDAPEEYLALNPLGKIPTFVGADGYVLTESIAIALYAVTSQDEETTLLGTSKESASILRWMSFGITEILPALGGWFNPLIGRAPFNVESIKKAREDTLFRLSMLDSHLRGRGYLVGDTLSLADLFVLGIVQGAFRFFLDPVWRREHPGISGWFERVHSLPMVVDVAGGPVVAEAEMPIALPKD